MGKRVIVVGGGISGLTAAAELAQGGCDVTLLEAGNRLGGRILTHRTHGHLVELGAEFVHGHSEEMEEALKAARLQKMHVSKKNQILSDGNLREVDIWGRAGEVISNIDPLKPDEPFIDFLRAQDFDKDTKRMTLGFVEGFNASDARRIGAHALLRAEFSAGDEGDKQKRIAQGYKALPESFAEKAKSAGAKIHLNVSARSVFWKRGEVKVESLTAEAAVITVPLGVLKRGGLEFRPSLIHKQDAINGLQFGNVVKLIFVFERAWWPEANFGFIHDYEAEIPTWWSDARGPVLVGWAAGPKADRLLNQSPRALRRIGLDILEHIFGRIEEPVDFQYYDWSSDENIRGAYSYIPVNGLDLPKVLAEPIEDTLFFAGEATATDAQMGTVSGALSTGLRAAREVLLLPT